MLCFLAPTTFGTEYWLTHAIKHHQPKTDQPCSVVSLRQVSYLLTSTSILSIKIDKEEKSNQTYYKNILLSAYMRYLPTSTCVIPY